MDAGSFEDYLEDASLENGKSTTLRLRPSGSVFCINYQSSKGRPCRSWHKHVKVIASTWQYWHSLLCSLSVCSPSLAKLFSIDYMHQFSICYVATSNLFLRYSRPFQNLAVHGDISQISISIQIKSVKSSEYFPVYGYMEEIYIYKILIIKNQDLNHLYQNR